MSNEQEKLVRIDKSGSICCSWLSSRRVPIKTRHNQPIQLDLVEWINRKEKENGKKLRN